ncbi:MAG TPA: DUF2652 domain-containing protein [Candidatus Limnocylindria bacterium]|nr:DUF2652 domain-containing protein [Candidatus Limnocylindria bacterium]
MTGPSASEPSILLIADISGYTAFLRAVEQAHSDPDPGREPPAYRILGSLLDTVVQCLVPTFEVVQVEGDAIFARAPVSRLAGRADECIALVRRAHADFKRQLAEAQHLHGHDCLACTILPTIDLKFIVHAGVAVPQRVAGASLLAGQAVNVVHRMLKNDIVERMGLRSYVFMSDAAASALGVAPDTGRRHVEGYPDVGSVSGAVVAI